MNSSLFWIAIAMTIVANLGYNLSTKTAAAIHPLASLAVSYAVSLLTCLTLYPMLSKEPNLLAEVKQVNWAAVTLGLSIVLLESGFILAFRSGWNISYAALFSNTVVTLILIPIGLIIFKESLSWTNGLGMVLAIAGLFLMVRR